MTGLFVIPGYLFVNFSEDGRLRQLQVPLDESQMIELAGFLLSAAAAMSQPQPQPQPSAQRPAPPAAKLREKPETWRHN